MLEIKPANIQQIQRAGDDWIIIDDDVCGVAQSLKEIDERLQLRNNPIQGFYAIFVRESRRNGAVKEYLVTTSTSLDQRLVERIKKISHPDYDFSAELDKLDQQADKEQQYKLEQKMGDNAEQLAFAVRKELGLDKDKAFFNGN